MKTAAVKTTNIYKIMGIAALVLMAALVAGIAFYLIGGNRGTVAVAEKPSAATGLVMDGAATAGGWETPDPETVVASLNEKVQEGMINISMNTAPLFANGASEGSLMIVNEDCNRYPQIVEIFRNDTGEPIYRSGGIPVGSKIESAKLDVALPAGVYECTAMFHNVDPSTGASLGQAGAIINITVLN